MKKIFTLAAAVLASVSMWATIGTYYSATPAASSLSVPASTEQELAAAQATIVGGKLFAVNNDTKAKDFLSSQSSSNVFLLGGTLLAFKVTLDQAIEEGDTISVVALTNGSGASNGRGIWVTTATARPGSAPGCELMSVSASKKEYVEAKHVVASSDDICGKDTVYIWRATGNNTYFKDFAIYRPAPTSAPVAEVTISGPEAGFVGRTVSLKASTDVKADTLFWTVDGSIQDNHTATLALELAAARTYKVACHARNANNAVGDWIIGEHEVVATVKPVLDQVSVSESTTWDWTKAASVAEIKFTETTDIKKNDRVLLANVDDMYNNEDFNSQALLFEGEYAVRSSSFCQGQLIKFTTTVAGKLSVDYSNTGGNPNRALRVNNVAYGDSTASATKITADNIPVAIGDVEITAVHGEVSAYLRIYKIVFTKDEETAVENIEADEKAAKFFENGQLVIIKNGVRYNAQGSIVR